MEPEQGLADLRSRMASLEADVGSRLAVLERQVAGLTAALAPRREAGPAGREPVSTPIPPGATPSAPAPMMPPPPRPADAAGGRDPVQADVAGPAPIGWPGMVEGQQAPGLGARRPARSGPRFELGVEAVLRWVGIGLVVLAAVFLVSTAIDRGWISPELQLLGATLIGFGLLGAGARLRETQRAWALALANGGAVVVIVCAGAAYGWLELWDAVTGLGLVAVAAAVSVLVAMKLRFESVAITSTVAMLLVPAWARIIADGPVLATGVWLGGFAIVATAVGIERGWSLYRSVSTWAAAIWVIGLAGYLFADDNTAHLVSGAALVAVVGATLWLGPALAGRSPERALGTPRTTLAALDHRSVVLIPVWAWYSVLLFGGFDVDVPGGWLGLVLAAGFAAVAMAAGPLIGRITTTLFVSHLLGAGILITVAIVAWLGGSILMVALAGQALATLVIGYHFKDELLKWNAYLLAAGAWAVLVDGLTETIDRATFDVGDSAAHAVVIVALAAMAWVTDRDRPRPFAELVHGLVWLAGLGFAVSLLAPVVGDEGWLAVGVVLAATSLLAQRLGPWVQAMGAAMAVATVVGGGVSILITAIDGNDIGGHLANLSVLVGLAFATRWIWIAENRPDAGRALLVVAWVFGLGWPASVFLAELEGSQSQVAISAAWALAACGAIVVAIRSDESVVRFIGLGTLAVVLIKLLTVDLAEVDTLWRVGLFLVIGLGLLRLGYVLPALAERYGPDPGPDGGPSGESSGGPSREPSVGSSRQPSRDSNLRPPDPGSAVPPPVAGAGPTLGD